MAVTVSFRLAGPHNRSASTEIGTFTVKAFDVGAAVAHTSDVRHSFDLEMDEVYY